MKFKVGDKTQGKKRPSWKNMITGIEGDFYIVTIIPDDNEHKREGWHQDMSSYHEHFELDKEYIFNESMKEVISGN